MAAPPTPPVVSQDPQWVWECLWTAVGEEGEGPAAATLNIPDTVLVNEAGLPVRWVGTSPRGVVVRKRIQASGGGSGKPVSGGGRGGRAPRGLHSVTVAGCRRPRASARVPSRGIVCSACLTWVLWVRAVGAAARPAPWRFESLSCCRPRPPPRGDVIVPCLGLCAHGVCEGRVSPSVRRRFHSCVCVCCGWRGARPRPCGDLLCL